MLHRVARFEKVSYDQFKKDIVKIHAYDELTETEIRMVYDGISIPSRGTKGSAGYDFYAPYRIEVPYGKSATIPTGLRCRIEEGWFLDINPRSGQGFQYGIRLANTRGIIDSDYYNADNEGHIMVKILNDSCIARHKGCFSVEKGKSFCQGIFTVFGLTEDDAADKDRTGGFGSTDG